MKDFEIRCDESRLETNHTIYGKFTLGPFLPGQGTTFGNVLRRSLLSELSGLAITAFEILGIMQEFSTLPGLRESVLDLSLNLKQVALTGTLPYSTPPIGFLKVRGPAVIKAADLIFPAGIYCASPNQYIATLSSNGALNLKFLVSVGKGYSTQPYSFYHSLSKVKLQSTFSSDTENNLVGKDSVCFPKEFFEQRKSDYNSENLSAASTVKQEALGLASFGQQGAKAASQAKVAKEEAPEANGTNVSDEGGENLRTKSRTPSASLPTDAKGAVSNARSLISGSEIKLENVLNTKDQKFVQSRNSEFLNPASTYIKNTNELSTKLIEIAERRSSSSVDVQTQIFQRINPHQVLPIDAVFTPVSRVNFLTQVNDRFELARENIVIEIWTNGSIHPKRALEEATLSLVQNFDTLLKKIQKSSSFYKGLRYWSYLQSLDSDNKTLAFAEKKIDRTDGVATNLSSEALELIDPSINYSTNVPYNKEDQVNTITSNMFAMGKKGDIRDSSEKYLHRAIYNLDIGNLDLSLETFILLKKAKINTLAQLLTNFCPQENKITINLNDLGVTDHKQPAILPPVLPSAASQAKVVWNKEQKVEAAERKNKPYQPSEGSKSYTTSTTEGANGGKYHSVDKVTNKGNSLFLSEKIVNELNHLINQFQFN